jgi:hypothetical protein
MGVQWDQTPTSPRQLGGRGVLRDVLESGVAEEARTRGFAAPAFAGCAFVEECGVQLRCGTASVKTDG